MIYLGWYTGLFAIPGFLSFYISYKLLYFFFFFQAEDGIRDLTVTGVQTCALPISFARRLRATPGKDIWMMGGAGLIASFLDENEIDDFIIHVIPTLIGEGIPLIAPRHLDVPPQLRSCRRYSDGVVRLHYSVLKLRPRKGRGGNARPNKRLKLAGAAK